MMRSNPTRKPNEHRGTEGPADRDAVPRSVRVPPSGWTQDPPATLAPKWDDIKLPPKLAGMERSPWEGHAVEEMEARVLKQLAASPLDAQMRQLHSALESLGDYVCTSSLLTITDEETRWAVERLRCVHDENTGAVQRLADGLESALESAPRHSCLLSLRELVQLYGLVSSLFSDPSASRPVRGSEGEGLPPEVDVRRLQMAVLKSAMRGIRAAFYFREFDREKGLIG